jgi:hypothetical protein
MVDEIKHFQLEMAVCTIYYVGGKIFEPRGSTESPLGGEPEGLTRVASSYPDIPMVFRSSLATR